MSRNAPQYSQEDRKVLNMFKEEYRRLVDSKERDAMLRSKIFPSMFNHWKVSPDSLTEEEKACRLKALKKWIINNWRPYGKANSRPKKMTYIDVICRTKADEVDAELNEIFRQDSLERNEQNVFQQRRRAAKRVYERLSDVQKEAVDATAKAHAESGNPVWLREIKGEKGAWKSAQKWSRDAWLDMGVLSITFFAFIKPNKNLAVDICDDMAMHVNARQSFVQKHGKEVEEMKKLFINYVKDVYPRNQTMNSSNAEVDKAGKNPTTGGTAKAGKAGNNPMTSTPLSTGNIYPSLADVELRVLSKKQLVKVMRDYFKAHYTLATGGKYTRIPYGRLEENPSEFIDAEYYPPAVTLKDPQNMQMEDIKTLLSHIQAREVSEGILDAFRFKRYWHTSGLRDATYAALLPADTSLTEGVGGHKKTTTPAANPLNPTFMPQPTTITLPESGIAIPHEKNMLINQETMGRLTALGIPTSVPVNGPGDGQPMYYMPHPESGIALPDNIDPALLGIPPHPRGKRSR